MIIQIHDDFNLSKIAESGQCFRWQQTDARTWRIPHRGKCLYITEQDGSSYELDCSKEEFAGIWQEYFDLQENYEKIRARIDPDEDPFLFAASENEKGIRILRQDPWEMLITSIITQNRNIPAIKRSVELLAEACGKQHLDARGRTFFSFPKPDEILSLSFSELSQCRLGYRCKYVRAAAEAAVSGELDLARLQSMDENSALTALTKLYGVGMKVASCVTLFGLHHLDAFPVDVWIKRVLEQEYPGGYPFEKYSPYNGIYQQYMFAYYRFNRGSGVIQGDCPRG